MMAHISFGSDLQYDDIGTNSLCRIACRRATVAVAQAPVRPGLSETSQDDEIDSAGSRSRFCIIDLGERQPRGSGAERDAHDIFAKPEESGA
jgi:hypothetical protein